MDAPSRIVQGQAGQGFEQPDKVETIPAHDQGGGLAGSGVGSGGGFGLGDL